MNRIEQIIDRQGLIDSSADNDEYGLINRNDLLDFAERVIQEVIKINYESGLATAQKVALENMYRKHFGDE